MTIKAHERYVNPEGKLFKLVPLNDGFSNPCEGCAFDRNVEPSSGACMSAPICTVDGKLHVFVEDKRDEPEEDFLAGVKACDLSGDTGCEACQ